jgi:DNA-binding NtrC family response regulator
MRSILLCDDEPRLSRTLTAALTGAGYIVYNAGSCRAAIETATSKPVDLVLTDMRLPDSDGLAVLKALRSLPSAPDALVMTGYATVETAVEGMKIAQVLERRDLQEHNGQLQEQLDYAHRMESLVGTSAAMREVLEQLYQVASTDATVLLLGESGTGKSLLARALHHQSRRRSAPLCEVHCAALPESLLESELFGHERGAFTGAVEQRIGHVERADKGTLFLDEIGELPASIQVKLLRFLQDRQFFRVGSAQVRSVDVRFVFASNRDLVQAVRDRSLREDFYYRINVFPIRVPALRERADDIPQLVLSFLKRRHPHLSIAPAALGMLTRYPWPGNVRELENVLERATILAGTHAGAMIQTAHLPRSLAEAPPIPPPTLLTPGFSLDGLERELIHEALARAGGNKTEAAKLLGVTRRRLYSRLKSMESDSEEAPSSTSPLRASGPG